MTASALRILRPRWSLELRSPKLDFDVVCADIVPPTLPLSPSIGRLRKYSVRSASYSVPRVFPETPHWPWRSRLHSSCTASCTTRYATVSTVLQATGYLSTRISHLPHSTVDPQQPATSATPNPTPAQPAEHIPPQPATEYLLAQHAQYILAQPTPYILAHLQSHLP